jgi:hypothetical protein
MNKMQEFVGKAWDMLRNVGCLAALLITLSACEWPKWTTGSAEEYTKKEHKKVPTPMEDFGQGIWM